MKKFLWICAVGMIGMGILVWVFIFVLLFLRNEAAWLHTAYRYSYALMCIAVLLIIFGIGMLSLLNGFGHLLSAPSYHPPKPNPARVTALHAWMEPLKKRCITYDVLPGFMVTIGCSKEGGVPDLPAGRRVPLDDDGQPLKLIVQLRCCDLAPYDPEGLYPHTGMLYFFNKLVLYCEHDEDLVSTADNLDRNGHPIAFRTGWDFPDYYHAIRQVAESTWEDYTEALGLAGCTDHDGQLGGYTHPKSDYLFVENAWIEQCEVLLHIFDYDGRSVMYLIEPKCLTECSFANTHCLWS
jgi:hypothetical protein